MRVSIATKIVIWTLVIVSITGVLISDRASKYFSEYALKSERYANDISAVALANEVRLQLDALQHQVLNISVEAMKNPPLNGGELAIDLTKVEDLLALQVYTVQNGSLVRSGYKENKILMDLHHLPSGLLDEMRGNPPFPLLAFQKRPWQVRNTGTSRGVALLTIGFPIAKMGNNFSQVVVADFQISAMQRFFANPSVRKNYLVDENGDVISHFDEAKVLNRSNLRSSPLVEKAIQSSATNYQFRFVDPETGEANIGVYQKISNWGLTVIAQTSEVAVMEPVVQIRRQVIFNTAIVLSISLFFCFIFALTLSSPIETLTELIQQIPKGNFDLRAQLRVNSSDEVGVLAKAIDKMSEGLRERDKIKTLFNKFHGSTVGALLMRDGFSQVGTKKEVTVMFSDIRDFTQYSNATPPEEVVKMLNEYLDKMVRIIHKNGGIVDKFIGDAIMAVWGAPHSTVMDAHNAVKACLEMRAALVGLNNSRKSRGLPEILIGMGLHTGLAISGTIGPEDRKEFTIIGDTVNTASRIESATKSFGADLLISAAVMEKVKSEYLVDPAGSAEVKGKAEPLQVFRVRGYRDANGGKRELRTPYSDFKPAKSDKVKTVA